MSLRNKPARITFPPPATIVAVAAARRPMTIVEACVRSILMFLIGVPLPIILLVAFCTHGF